MSPDGTTGGLPRCRARSFQVHILDLRDRATTGSCLDPTGTDRPDAAGVFSPDGRSVVYQRFDRTPARPARRRAGRRQRDRHRDRASRAARDRRTDVQQLQLHPGRQRRSCVNDGDSHDAACCPSTAPPGRRCSTGGDGVRGVSAARALIDRCLTAGRSDGATGRRHAPPRRYNRGHGPPSHPDPRRRHRSGAGGGDHPRPRRDRHRLRVGDRRGGRGRDRRVRDAAPGARPRVDPAQPGRAQGPDHDAGRRRASGASTSTLRQALGLYANLRPARSMEGLETRYEDVDLVIVRENTEDLYAGIEHMVGRDAAESIKIITRGGVRADRPLRLRVRGRQRPPARSRRSTRPTS